jgi:hypothetical protein
MRRLLLVLATGMLLSAVLTPAASAAADRVKAGKGQGPAVVDLYQGDVAVR